MENEGCKIANIHLGCTRSQKWSTSFHSCFLEFMNEHQNELEIRQKENSNITCAGKINHRHISKAGNQTKTFKYAD